MSHNTVAAALLLSLGLLGGIPNVTANVVPPVLDQSAMVDNVSLSDYLAVLENINPVAREGAELYLSTFRERCGPSMSTLKLRRAFALAEPVLMATIRHLGLGDRNGAVSAARHVACGGS